MVRWQAGLEHRQNYLGRLVDIGAELFAMCAVCVQARAFGGVDDLPLADLCCRRIEHRIEGLFHELWHNTDSRDYQVAQDVLDGRWIGVEDGILDLTGDLPLIAEEHASNSL